MDQGQPLNEAAASQPTMPGLDRAFTEDLQSWLDLGGPIVWILMLMALLGIAIFLLKLWHYRGLGGSSRRHVDNALRAWNAGRRDQARRMLQQDQPVARAVRVAMSGLLARHSEETIREETTRIANEELNDLRRYLRPLELIATLSPLLGLLGTVIGMIEAFQSLQASGTQVDPSILSGGIWQALLTTAVGLSVAIPATLAHGWLESRVEDAGHAMEDAVTRVFTGGSDAWTDTARNEDDAGFVIPDAI